MNTATTPSDGPKNSTTVRSKIQHARQALLGRGLQALGRAAPAGAAAVAERMFLTPRRHPRPAPEQAALATARHLLVPGEPDAPGPVERGPLASWEWGDAGPRVLLVHGWEGRGAQLAPLVPPLLAAGFRVVTFDAPSHGDSPGARSSLVHFADAVRRVARAWGPFEAMITHSMGGAAAAWAQRDAPLARSMVMIAPPADVREFTRRLSEALSLGDAVRARVDDRLATRFGVAPAELAMARLAPTMNLPLLVVHDEDDREVPITSGELVAARWPGARLLRTRALGHRRILRDEAVIRAAVDFVSARAGA
ncbi:MAG: alpha/beta hydrolase [Polyangiales bacterium]